MPVTTLATVNDIMNRVAAEVGIEPVSDPFNSGQQAFTQMRYLMQTAGEELLVAHPWELLTEAHQITTVDTDSGDYDLPDDFYYMINQTGWERTSNIPLFGPLSPQDWTYLLGRDLVDGTIYASFRLKEGKFSIFPQPPPNGLDINFEYIGKNWVQDGQQANVYTDIIKSGVDIPQFDKTLISRHLKMKYLEAKGFDTTKAQDDFNQSFNFLTGFDKGAEILSAGRGGRGFPYLDARYNTPDTKFGDWDT
jgi:hypothetical protein